MIAVVIGTGDWTDAARCTAKLITQKTGLEAYVVESNDFHAAHPSWLKAKVIEMFPGYDSFLVQDADCLPVNSWNPERLFNELGRPFCAVPDRNVPGVLEECTQFGLPYPEYYVNGGMVLFGKEHARIWEFTWGKQPKYGKYLEQSALNEALFRSGVPVCRLPRRFNHLICSLTGVVKLVNVVNMHLAASGTDALGSANTLAALKQIQAKLAKCD